MVQGEVPVSMEETMKWIEDKCEDLAVDEYSIIGVETKESQARFSNNSLTTVNHVFTLESILYMTKGKKRILGLITSTTREGVERLVKSLYTAMTSATEAEFASLPKGPFRYSSNLDYERSEEFDFSSYVTRTIDSAVLAGAKRVAGSIEGQRYLIRLNTSAGAEGEEIRTSFMLNVRAFTERDASGHGLSVATQLKDFDVESAGRRAGELSKAALSPKQVEEGKYTVLFGRTVFANLIESVGYSASAFSVESGLSFLPSKLGEQVAVQSLSVIDHGQISGGVSSRSFDDEGLPTQTTEIIKSGLMENHLHNSTTAMKWKTRSTSNAGIIEPHPWNLEVKEGDSSIDEMISETKKGIYVTNNWYTRYQSYKLGEYSTLPRDYAALIENGEVRYAITGFRISDAIPRQLKSIRLLGKERSWVKWWEVRTPVLCPDVLIDGVSVTRATS